ncbi:MAG: glycosyltransferase family 2 protein [Bacteroidales bacterium]|nr:glycosyltransferase family 2 protein [Bacteroidales bacterium]
MPELFSATFLYINNVKQMDVYFAIPVLDENDFLFKTLDCIAEQSYNGKIFVYICVNQPDSWWNISDKFLICVRNEELFHQLEQGYRGLDIHLIDKTRKENGWSDKKSGVGIARKTIADEILMYASDTDIFISMDADTLFENNFVQEIVHNFHSFPEAVAMNLPYYHSLSGNETQDRALLRYELYLRNFMLNMLHVNSPYAFAAFGSAIACKIKDYKAVRGFDTQIAGEDFYFLQKMAKYGKIKLHTDVNVFPSSRFSERVAFGTGTALADFQKNTYRRYPFFHFSSFDNIYKTYLLIDELFTKDIENEFLEFQKNNCKVDLNWGKLRNNYKTIPMFTKAFHHKIDGLRLFQFVRYAQTKLSMSDEACLLAFMNKFYPNKIQTMIEDVSTFTFQNSPIASLNQIRDFLVVEEDKMRKQHDSRIFTKKKE